MSFMGNKLSSAFNDNEYLIRAVYPPSKKAIYWNRNNKVSPVAFRDDKGLSVNRSGNETKDYIVNFSKERLDGLMYSATVKICQEFDIFICYKPSYTNIYHTELHGSSTSLPLTHLQSVKLANNVICEYIPEKYIAEFVSIY